jgi:hypothetical protein
MLHVASSSADPGLHQYRLITRRALAVAIVALTTAYAALLFVTYFQLTPSSAILPELGELERLLFGGEKPVSRIERLLESTGGPMSRGGTMRPAFTDQSLGWELLTQNLPADEEAALLANREGERLAMLDWIRTGADRTAYENDRYELSAAAGVQQISADYVIPTEQPPAGSAATTVRIRTLLADRCVTCHGENGRHDIARFIELDTYDRLQPHLLLELQDTIGRPCLLASFLVLFPLTAISAPLFWRTSQPRSARTVVIGVTFAAIATMSACWLLGLHGPRFIVALLAAAGTVVSGVLVQLLATVSELLGIPY